MERAFRNPVKHALREGRASIGSWITLGHPSVAEILGLAGFDFLVADLEHSVIGLDAMQNLFIATERVGASPLARASENDPKLVSRIMDAGAHGVIVPMINSAEEAERVVAAVKYPPAGRRGVGLARAQRYGFHFEEYREAVNAESLVVVQIEHRSGVDRIEDILATEGVDAYIIGPYDLSASFGVPGELDHPDVQGAIAHVKSAAEKLGVPAGFHAVEPEPEKAIALVAEGYSLVAFSVDMLFLARTSRRTLEQIRKGIAR